jgi:hypothetical protein
LNRKRSSQRHLRTRHGSPESEIATVPTFQPDVAKVAAQLPPKTPEEEAAEEFVRRMVEAAYT